MKAIQRILNRSIAAAFYRQHAGFFLFIFFLLFGTQPSLYHALLFHGAIIRSILVNTHFFLIAALLWLLYAAKTYYFLKACLKKNAFLFLRQLNAVPLRQRLLCLLRLQTLVFAPVWIYALLLFFIAVTEKYYLGGIAVLVLLLLICSLCVWGYQVMLKKAGHGSPLSWFSRFFPRLPTNIFVFLIRYIFREQLVALFVIKLLSFFSLYALARLEAPVYEYRILWLIFITALIAHSVLIYRNHQFIETRMLFIRNLPLQRVSLFFSLLAVYTMVLFPEIWALKGVAVSQNDVAAYGWMILAGPFVLLLMHCLLYTEDMKMEAYIQLLFGAWIVLIFFSLSQQRWLIPVICGMMGFFIFYSNYYKYEKMATVDKLE